MTTEVEVLVVKINQRDERNSSAANQEAAHATMFFAAQGIGSLLPSENSNVNARAIPQDEEEPGTKSKVAACACYCCISCLGLAFPIAMVVIGSSYLSDCPLHESIPPILVSAGVLLIVLVITMPLACSVMGEHSMPGLCWFLYLAIICSVLALCIAGSVERYSSFAEPRSSDPDSRYYCDKTVYDFSYWGFIVLWIFIGIGLLTCYCTGCKF